MAFIGLVIGPACSEAQDEPVEQTTQIAKGIVFEDVDGNGKFGGGDHPKANIKVSNGQEIVLTNEEGRYELPVGNDAAVFVIKPSGFSTPLSENKLPKFYYLHKPDGSPKLKYPGVKPTGPLPQSIDFPLHKQTEPEDFKILLFGDPQPRNNTEVDYISQDVVAELIGGESSFGVTLGDIAFDNLETFETLNQSIAMIGIPWYNVIGNHDINLDAKTRDHINETYEATYGPSYYSFDYGQVHFVVLDNIDWAEFVPKVKPQKAKPDGKVDQGKQDAVRPKNQPRPKPRFRYQPTFGPRQLEFLKSDLALIPKDQMLVLLMHVPIMGVTDKVDFFKLIEDRPYCVSVSGHTHDHRHMFLGAKDGFDGEQKHHHIVNVTVSGSWWSGAKNDNGVPHATMPDGGPNGYSIMNFDKDGYKLDYKAAGAPASQQMRVLIPASLPSDKTGEQDVWVNVYNGSEKSTVEMSIDGEDWTKLEKQMKVDPYYVWLAARDADTLPKPSKPKVCHHLWHGKLPADMSPGAHLVRVKTTDRHGRTYHAHRSVRVAESKKATSTNDK